MLNERSLVSQFLHFVAATVASLMVFSLYSIVDGLFVAKGVGEYAMAAVNLAVPFTNVLFSIGIIFGGSFPTGHHLSFMPRVREGGILAASGVATSMMDLSDGLGTDLPRLAAASGLGFRIHEELLPVRPGFTAAQAVGDGEDYELLVTFRPGDRERAARLAAEHFPETPLTVIGEMTAETASALPPGYRHFS